MSNFIDKADYLIYIEERRLDQITESNATFLDVAETTAETIIKDALYQWFKVDDIFSTTGTNRPAQVIRWMVTISVYFLYKRVPDSAIPERVTKDYDEVIDMLKQIELGKRSIRLDPELKVDNETPITRFRGGSNPKRSH